MHGLRLECTHIAINEVEAWSKTSETLLLLLSGVFFLFPSSPTATVKPCYSDSVPSPTPILKGGYDDTDTPSTLIGSDIAAIYSSSHTHLQGHSYNYTQRAHTEEQEAQSALWRRRLGASTEPVGLGWVVGYCSSSILDWSGREASISRWVGSKRLLVRLQVRVSISHGAGKTYIGISFTNVALGYATHVILDRSWNLRNVTCIPGLINEMIYMQGK